MKVLIHLKHPITGLDTLEMRLTNPAADFRKISPEEAVAQLIQSLAHGQGAITIDGIPNLPNHVTYIPISNIAGISAPPKEDQ